MSGWSNFAGKQILFDQINKLKKSINVHNASKTLSQKQSGTVEHTSRKDCNNNNSNCSKVKDEFDKKEELLEEITHEENMMMLKGKSNMCLDHDINCSY